jgi:uncharacterized membrane protein (UPF0127 family)
MRPEIRARDRVTLTSALRGAMSAALLGMAIACDGGSVKDDPAAYANLLPYDSADVRIASRSDTTRLTVELADTQEKQTLGLMERRSLPETGGMLFLYATDQPETSAFWMFRTRIPLDIAFIDSAGVIRSIKAMQPCQSDVSQSCPDYQAGARYRAALEVNAGFFQRHNLGIGDRVFLEDTTTRRRPASAR